MRTMILALGLLMAPLVAFAQPEMDARRMPETTRPERWMGSWDTSQAGNGLNRQGLTIAKSITFAAGPGGACLDAATGQPAIGRARAGAPGFDLYAESVKDSGSKVKGGVAYYDSTAPSGVVPYDCYGNVLNVHLAKINGQWQSGHFYGVDSSGRFGDSAPFGLFEQTIVLPPPPPGEIPWPAAWSGNHNVTNKNSSFIEIDWMECGISAPTVPACYINLYNWPGPHPDPMLNQLQSKRVIRVQPTLNPFDGRPHTYSALITPRKIVVYWDGVEMVRYPVTSADMTYNHYHAADLSMYYDPGQNSAPYNAQWLSFQRWTCAPFPMCLDFLNP